MSMEPLNIEDPVDVIGFYNIDVSTGFEFYNPTTLPDLTMVSSIWTETPDSEETEIVDSSIHVGLWLDAQNIWESSVKLFTIECVDAVSLCRVYTNGFYLDGMTDNTYYTSESETPETDAIRQSITVLWETPGRVVLNGTGALRVSATTTFTGHLIAEGMEVPVHQT